MTPDLRSARLPRRPSVLLLAAAAAALAACGGSEGGGGDGGVVVDTVAGVERTLWPGEGGEVLWRGVDTVATLGAAFGGQGLVFASLPGPRALDGDGRGSLWVLDAGERRIHRFDSTGALRASWGRRGEGPGELEGPAAIAAGAGDSVWVHDGRLDRITVYPPDGEGNPRTVALDVPGMFTLPLIAPRADGSHLQELRSHPPVMGGPDDRTVELIARVGPDGALLDTVLVSERPPTEEVRIPGDGGSVRFYFLQRQFAPELRWTPQGEGRIAAVLAAPYRLRVLDSAGRELRRFGRRGDPRPVEAADREGARERRRERADSAVADRIVEAMTFADAIPTVEALIATPDRRLWVRTAPAEAGGEFGVDVFDADGRLLGRAVDVPWPHAFVTDRLIARVIRDELDVPRVQLLRLRPAAD